MSVYTFEDYDLYTIGYDFANRQNETMVVRAPSPRIAIDISLHGGSAKAFHIK